MTDNKKAQVFDPKYDEQKGKMLEFLSQFEDQYIPEDPVHGRKKYLIQLQRIPNGQSNIIEIHLEDLEEFFHSESEEVLLDHIKRNTLRYVSLLSDAADALMPERNVPLTLEEVNIFLIETKI